MNPAGQDPQLTRIPEAPVPSWQPDPHERGAIFLDDDHAYLPMTTADGRVYAINECHRDPNGGWCWGPVYLNGSGGPGPKWTVISEDPLTLTPSIVCTTCNEHGWIEGGRWRPA